MRKRLLKALHIMAMQGGIIKTRDKCSMASVSMEWTGRRMAGSIL